MADADDLSTIGGRIRWAITKRLKINQAEAARRLKIKPSQLSRWVNDPDNPPNEKSLERIAKLTGLPKAWLRYGGELPQAGVSVTEEKSTYQRTPIGVQLLRARARTLYQQFMGELFVEGCGQAEMERASEILLAPIIAAEELPEPLQVEVLQSMMEVVRKDLGIGAPGSESIPEPGGTVSERDEALAAAERMLQDFQDAGQWPGDDEHPEEAERRRHSA